jgi:hypothetical protein
MRPEREIRAQFTDGTVRVYQAYSPAISEPALRAQRFVEPFRLSRMTWIKPSFLWMMYRSDWGRSDGQERILAIDIDRSGFEWALEHACLSHFDGRCHASETEWKRTLAAACVRIQWDPERDPMLNRLEYRAIQIGLSGDASQRYARDWIRQITDLTPLVTELREQPPDERAMNCRAITQLELPYVVSPEIATRLGIAT